MNTGDESLLILSSWGIAQMKVNARIAQIELPKTERMAVIKSMIFKFLSSAVSGPMFHFVNYIRIDYMVRSTNIDE